MLFRSRPTRNLFQSTPPSRQPHNSLQLQPSPSHNNSPSKAHQTGETETETSTASKPFPPSHTISRGSNNLNHRQYTSKQEPGVQSHNPPRSTKQHPDSYRRSRLNEQPPSISPKLQRISELNGAQKAKTMQGRNVKADVKVIKTRRAQSSRLRKAIFIPSTLTVATLAKLMNTKLGEYLYFLPETLLLTI